MCSGVYNVWKSHIWLQKHKWEGDNGDVFIQVSRYMWVACLQEDWDKLKMQIYKSKTKKFSLWANSGNKMESLKYLH